MLESTLIESWQQLPLSDKRYIIRKYGSFGQWMTANLECFKIKQHMEN